VADLGCGAGSDTLAFADAGLRVVAVEQDPATADLARANVASEGYAERVDVRVGDVTALDVAKLGCEAAYVDPARRSGGSRRFDPEGWSPPWSWVASLAERVPATVAKVAPGIPHDLLPPGAEGEWVSWRGDLKEAAVWHGPLATARRRATLLPSGATLTDAELPPDVAVGAVGGWLVEPDDAVIRSGLVAAVAAQVAGRLVDAAIAYVVTDTEPLTAFGTTYQVLAEIPFALKRMRGELRARGYGDVVVKKRGVAVVPEELRRRLALGGGGPTATVVLTRTTEGPLALLVGRRT
jgi:SAM-dependent methyltransferase